MDRRPHVVVVPLPAQGHVNPLMHLSQIIAKNGIKVTFVNSDFNHKRVLNAMENPDTLKQHSSNVDLVSIPDGLEATADRNEHGKLIDSIMVTMPQQLEELITCKLNKNDPVTAMVFDVNCWFVQKIGTKMGIKTAGFFPSSAASFALYTSIPKLIQEGIIDHNGYAKKKQIFQLYGIPPVETENLIWTTIGDPKTQNTFFKMISSSAEDLKDREWILCNSTHELEHGAFSMFPQLLQIGPLLADYDTNTSGSQFWPEDLTCLNWLDQQPSKSVIYVAFGSFTILDPTQFQELAEGLELTNMAFLWVVRPGLARELNYEIKTSRGKIVGWVPQYKVLQHPSIACFVTHCGWNSTIECVSHGVPFLCWPYFADQFHNKTYICDVWKVGLGFDLNESGIITKKEIKDKVEQLLEDKGIQINCSKLKRLLNESLEEGGRSSKNLENFINWLKLC